MLRRALALALVLWMPLRAAAQGTIDDFKTPPLQVNGGTIGEQWDNVIRALQGLGPAFIAEVKTGTDPIGVLNGLVFGKAGQSALYSQWRIIADASGDLALQVKTGGTDVSPVWTTRALFDDVLGLTSAPAAHTHSAADVVADTFANARISQGSVEQWATQIPAASRIPQADVSAQLAAGWISQNGVTQYQNALQLNTNQLIAGQLDDARLKASNVTQFGYLLTSGDIFMRASASCPTGTTEVTGARAAKIVGADTAGSSANYPDAAGILCRTGSVGTGCLAPSGNNYNDTQEVSELNLHTHAGPSHSHTTTIPDHTHAGASHTHSMAHTHDVVLGVHTHDWIRMRANADLTAPGGLGNINMVGDTDGGSAIDGANSDSTAPGSGTRGIIAKDLGTKTTTGVSTPNTGASGTGATGLAGGGTFGSSLSGTGSTSSTGGTDPSVGPIFSVRLCQVN